MQQQNGVLITPKVKLDFGGDYDRWWKDISSALEGGKFDKGLLLYCEPRRQNYLSLDVKENWEEGSVKLLAHLAVFSKLFRILDLPTELRFRIYEISFATIAPGAVEVLNLGVRRASTPVLPSLTKTCRQIRHGSLRLLISSRTLYFSLHNSSDEQQALRNMDIVRLWAEKCAKAYLRHIRAVDIKYMFDHKGFICHLSFTEHGGLQISLKSDDPEDYVDAEDDAKPTQLKEHAEKIEAERSVLDLKGESIVLALIRDTEVWMWSDDKGE